MFIRFDKTLKSVSLALILSAGNFNVTPSYGMPGGVSEEVGGDPAPKKRKLDIRNPLYDTTFKKLFGDKKCAIGLLNSIYCLSGPSEIKDVTYFFTENPPFDTGRGSVLDLHCKAADGTAFIIEMQRDLIDGMTNRLELYSATILRKQWDDYTSQLQSGSWEAEHRHVYGGLEPVRTLTFFNYNDPVFRGKPRQYIHHFGIRHTERDLQYYPNSTRTVEEIARAKDKVLKGEALPENYSEEEAKWLRFYTASKEDFPLQRWTLVDLPSARADLESDRPLTGLTDGQVNWLSLLTKGDHTEVELDEDALQTPVGHGYYLLAHLTSEERAKAEKEKKALLEELGAKKAAYDKGHKEGEVKGEEKGREEGEVKERLSKYKSIVALYESGGLQREGFPVICDGRTFDQVKAYIQEHSVPLEE